MSKKNAREEKNFKGYEISRDYNGTKHPATTRYYRTAKPTSDYYRDTPIDLVGCEIRCDEDGDVRFVGFSWFHSRKKREEFRGFYLPKNNQKELKKVMEGLCQFINDLADSHRSLAFYDKIKAARFLRLFLQYKEASKQDWLHAIHRYGNISAEFKEHGWVVDPVIETTNRQYYQDGRFKRNVEWGISQSIKDTIQFYFLPLDKDENYITDSWGRPFSVMAWDIESLFGAKSISKAYNQHIYDENDPNSEKFKGKDGDGIMEDKFWKAYETKIDFAKRVEFDVMQWCSASRLLGIQFQEYFSDICSVRDKETKEMKKVYPTGLYSAGSMTNFVLATLLDDDQEAWKSIGMSSLIGEWEEKGVDLKDILSLKVLSSEAYAGGLLQALKVGFTKQIWMSDIHSAYPSIVTKLLDLRNSTLRVLKTKTKTTKQKDEAGNYITKTVLDEEMPELDGKSYHFLRAVVEIPEEALHVLTVKPPRIIGRQLADGTWSKSPDNIHASGVYKVSGLREEFVQMEQAGGKLLWVEEYIVVETEGKPHPLAIAVQKLWEKRLKFIELGIDDIAIKTALNSLYGKMYEGFMTHTENNGFIRTDGYNMGIMYNTILSTVVTGFCRILLLDTANKIIQNKGEIVLMMQDALYWTGKGNELPQEYDTIFKDLKWESLSKNGWSVDKKLGWYSKPQNFSDFLCLGVGRYEMKLSNGETFVKARGVNLDLNGDDCDTWTKAIERKLENRKTDVNEGFSDDLKLKVKVRYVPQLIRQRTLNAGSEIDLKDEKDNYKKLGLVGFDEEIVSPVSVYPKRSVPKIALNRLQKKMYDTDNVSAYEFVKMGDLLDGTLDGLRKDIVPEHLTVTTEMRAERNRESTERSEKKLEVLCMWHDKLTIKTSKHAGIEFLEKAYEMGIRLNRKDVEDIKNYKWRMKQDHNIKRLKSEHIDEYLQTLKIIKSTNQQEA